MSKFPALIHNAWPTTSPVPALLLLLAICNSAQAEDAPDYNSHIAPLFKKYCTACHNPADHEGKLSLETYAELQQGGKHGPAVQGGEAKSSRLLLVLTGGEPKMPPEENEAPTAEEIALIKAWIEAGAKGPEGAEPDPARLLVPEIQPAQEKSPVTALAISPEGSLLAVGLFQKVELRSGENQELVRTIENLPGKVNSLQFSEDGNHLVVASGISGLIGRGAIYNVSDGSLLREFQGHRDILYAAALSPDGKILATAGYDRNIVLWNAETGERLRTLTGHNGPVFDLAFHPQGKVLASAGGDETIKLWQVETGERLDTLSQPTAEQYTVLFSPDGNQIVAGGADNRIRVWKFISRERPRINPLLFARYAHEGAIVALAFSTDCQTLISAAEDKSLKLFETRQYTQWKAFELQPDVVQSLATDAAGKQAFFAGRMDGSWQKFALPERIPQEAAVSPVEHPAEQIAASVPQNIAEAEPNDDPRQAMKIELPATVSGVIHPAAENSEDADCFRFSAPAGTKWVLETNAARSKSPLDTKIEVLTAEGQPVRRVLLQAVRDSYFTFRGKDSNTSDDFRVHNWQEMDLNNYLYANGEVVKLWHFPRGPDSGFRVYPGVGTRYAYFDTTAVAHALGEPCYIVEPRSPEETLIPNGLPVFPIDYENDDGSLRNIGSDSRLHFTSPTDGDYIVRVTDVRGFSGENYKYTLTVRPARPDFSVSLQGANPTVPAGSGREFTVKANRSDDYEGPIQIEIKNIPPGFAVSSPLVIEAGQLQAYGTIYALPGAAQPTPEQTNAIEVIASAEIAGKNVSHPVNSLGQIKLAEPPKIQVQLSTEDGRTSAGEKPLELVIHPGETIQAVVQIERQGHDGNVSFGNDESGRSLPHGLYVDNIGLNGLLILPNQNERTIFITATRSTGPTSGYFHLNANIDGGQTTPPILIHVRSKE